MSIEIKLLSGLLDSYRNFVYIYRSTANKVENRQEDQLNCRKICTRGDLFEDLFPMWISKLELYWQQEQPGRYNVLKKRMQLLKRYTNNYCYSGVISYKLIEKAHEVFLLPYPSTEGSSRRSQYTEKAYRVCKVILCIERKLVFAPFKRSPTTEYKVALAGLLKLLSIAINDFIGEIIFEKVEEEKTDKILKEQDIAKKIQKQMVEKLEKEFKLFMLNKRSNSIDNADVFYALTRRINTETTHFQ